MKVVLVKQKELDPVLRNCYSELAKAAATAAVAAEAAAVAAAASAVAAAASAAGRNYQHVSFRV